MIFGAKKGQKQQQKPHIAKDDLVSTSYFNGLYGLAEGEIAGLADGGKSIYLDGTPLINANGQPNFNGVSWDFRTGTLDQEHITGFSAVENERSVGVELRHDRAYVQAISNTDLSAVRVRLNFNALREQKTNGDITGYAIEYAIDVQTDGGAFNQVLKNTVRGKASQGFKKSHRIDLPKASKNWIIRVRRITPNRDSDLIADTVSIDAITEIIDAKLRYPATALLGLTYDATTFSNIAKLAVRLKGKLIQVPTNYDPVARTYTGLWDGTFKLAYSNNPAWVLYDICTHKRYGLGERLSGMVDKWRLYQIGQYCDELVDDGKGGKEPRFAINVYIQKDDDAYKVIQNIASVFRGLSYWDGTQIVVDSDTPKDPVYTFSAANIVGGEFSYTGTRARDRHTVVKTAWDNPDNGYKTEYELVRDERAIAKYGIRMLDIAVFGCTSQSQAQRAGQWALKSEQLEIRTVSFKTGLQGFIPQVGQVINVADNVFAGRAISGRVVSHNAQSITLDRMAGKVGDSISIGTQNAKITAVNGMVITTDKALNIDDDAVWAIVSDDLHLMQFRILSIVQNDDATFSITALQYEPQKYDAIDSGAVITPKSITALTATPVTAPTSVTISQSVRTHQNQSVTTMTINWTQVQGAVAYRVRWRKDDGNWQNIAKISGQSVDIDGVYSGNYIAEVQAIDAFDNESLATSSTLTAITGKVGKPPRLARLIATGKLFGMELTWSFNAGSGDTNYTEIQVSPDGRSNIATLGTFAYPTDKHTINGLQGNLRQFYRARIVDKLGNVSDWTAWTSGTTEAQAGKVLELLTGQITASQLHQDLSAPIAKIGTLESSLNTAKIDLSALNASMTTAKADIAKAKTDLNTAVGNIATERNRITTAIRDIAALQSANNAKTAEIANLTQTVNGYTGSIRDLAVTTGELSQRYTQLKTASDNANSEITAIKQTQSGQATQLNTLNSRFDSLSVGGRNLLRNSKLRQRAARDNTYNYETYTLTTSLNVGDSYTFSALVEFVAGQSDKVTVYDYQGGMPKHLDVVNNRISITFVATSAQPTSFLVYAGLAGRTNNNAINISNAKLEKGNIATDWTPAPEDIDAQFVQTDANISTLQQAVTNADNALSQRIDTLDASYKRADSTLSASIATEQQARTTADNALSQRITALDTAYKSADTQANAKIATLEQSLTDKDSAMSRRVDILQASYNTLNSTKASVASVTAEQKSRADADTALSQRITALDSAYKSADSALSARVATAEQSITTANQAIAQTQQTLTAKIDSLSVGGRNLLRNTATPSYLRWGDRGTLNNTRLDVSSVEDTVSIGIYTRFANINLDANTDYVLSFDVDTDLSAVDYIYLLEPNGNIRLSSITNPSGRVSVKFRTPRALQNVRVLVGAFKRAGNTYLDVRHLKLERGTLPTDWTPAPEDVDAQFVQTEASISTLQQTVTNADNALSQRIDTLDASYKRADRALNSSITAEQTARTNADNALSQRITALDTAYKSADTQANAKIATLEQSLTDKDSAMSRRVDILQASYNTLNNTKASVASVTAEQQARSTADTALSQRIDSLNSDYQGNKSSVASQLKTLSDADKATAQRLDGLASSFDSLEVGGRNLLRDSEFANFMPWIPANSAIRQSLYRERTYTQVRISQNITASQAGVCHAAFSRLSFIQAGATYTLSLNAQATPQIVATGLNYVFLMYSDGGGNFRLPTIAINWSLANRPSVTFTAPRTAEQCYLLIAVNGTYDADQWFAFHSVKLEKGNIATDWTPAPEDVDSATSAVQANLDEFKRTEALANNALSQRIDSLNTSLGTKANAAALNDLSTKVNQVDGKINAEAQKVSTLQTTVGEQTASIQQHSQSINGLSAQWTLKAESNGIVSGIGLASSNGVSAFAVRADQFYIAPPTGTSKGVLPFTVQTTPRTVNGVSVPAGTYIDNACIANGSIDIAKINKASIQSLSTLSANIGHFKSAETGARLEIKDSVLLVYDANNRLRVRLGLW